MAPRRWFRFSIKAIFVLVTLIACAMGWLGWQVQIVRHRSAMRNQIECSGGVLFVGHVDWKHSPAIKEVRPPDFHYKISWVRRWFGDQRVELIGFKRQLTDADRQALEAIPEAGVYAIP